MLPLFMTIHRYYKELTPNGNRLVVIKNRSVVKFLVNLLAALSAYSFLPRKPALPARKGGQKKSRGCPGT
jgi:hypothetical protein